MSLPQEYPKPGGDCPRIFPALLHGIKNANQGIRSPALALDAPNTGRTAAFVNFADGRSVAENLVQIANRTYVWVARIGTPHAGGIGHHGLELLPDHWLRVGEQDGVAVRLRHLAPVGSRQFSGRSQKRLWFGKNGRAPGAIEHVVAARDFAGQ